MTQPVAYEFALAATAEFVSAPSHPQFCQELVRHAAGVLGLDYVHVARLVPGQRRVATEAAWLDGAPFPDWAYDLANTPCEEVLGNVRRCIASGVQSQYPLDQDLKEIGASGYIGEPVVDSAGEVLGLIVGINRTPLRQTEVLQANLRILAARAGAIFEQRAAIDALRRERDTVHNILHTVEAIIVTLDIDGRITLINRKGCELLGYSEQELIGQDWFTTCLPPDSPSEPPRSTQREHLWERPGSADYLESPVSTRSGETRLIAWRSSRLTDSDGRLVGSLSAGEDITDRRLAERQLAESELRYRTLADSGQALIWAAGTDKGCHYFNRVWLDFTGRTPEQESGDGWSQGVHPEDYHHCLETYNTAFDRRERFSMDYRLRRHDGEYRWLQDDGCPRYDSAGEFIGYIGFCLDITDAREARATLQRKERYQQALLDNFPFEVWLKDTASRFLAVNRAFAESSNATSVDELVGKTDLDIWPADLAEGYRAADQAVMETREKLHAEEEISVHGSRRWFETYKAPVVDATGELLGTVGFARDISDRKHAEAALRDSETRYRLAFQTSPDSININRLADGRYLDVNDGFERLTGWTRAEVIGKTPLEIEIWSDLSARERLLQSLHEHGYCANLESTFVMRDRRLITGLISAHLMTLGGETCVLSITRDITDMRLAETALRESNARANSILRAAPVGIGVVVERTFTEVNDTVLRMTGYRREELVGQSARLLYPTDADYEYVGRDKYDQIRSQGMGSEETRWRRKDGSEFDIILSSSPIDPDDLSRGITFTAQDISERKQMEAALRESEAKFHTMSDWTYDWEYWTLPGGRFRYMTPSVERFTGYSADEFARDATLIERIVHPDDRPLWLEHSRETRSSDKEDGICELEFRIIQRGGDILWVAHRCRPVLDSDGRQQGRRVTVSDITARKEAEQQIRSLAYFDPLTGLPNRRLLLDRLGHALVSSKRSGQYGALLMLDLDHFKALNDTQGHDVGDRLLIAVAERMTSTLRAEDTVSRLGGDEYVVMLECLGTNERAAASEAERIADKIRFALNDPYTLTSPDQAHYCTPSIGLTLFRGLEDSVEVLLKQADVALYQAKDAGRNAVRFFSPAMQAAIESRMALETALRHALTAGELQLFYQPQIDQDGQCIGAEALLRWHRPDLGVVSPMQFIPLAEETGLIVPIGRWVVDTACEQLKAWESGAQTRSLQIAINVSARQFHQPDFVLQVQNSLERSGANPARLKLELTESVVLENADAVIDRMRQLRALGVGFSMDDFGTGYSSLSYLKRLPLDQLKIDQSFVRDITTDPSDAAIVRAILAMSHSLGLQVIAEGVETEEQQQFLRENGCYAYQGYLFGKPMPIDEWLNSD